MKKQRWVVKAGSQMVCSGGALLMRHWMQQVAKLRAQNIEVIWVTSGAIAWASERTKYSKSKRTLPEKQALSAIGQPLVMDHYNLALQANQLLGSQVLLTAGDTRDKVRSKNLQNTLTQLLKWKIIPILNENDAVATAEIQFGDNDTLAAQVAVMMNADKLILLTDVDGLYNDDPKKNKDAKLIQHVSRVNASILKLANPKNKSTVGTGGMYSKILAAKVAGKEGIITHLSRGDHPNNLLMIADNKGIGTQIGGSNE